MTDLEAVLQSGINAGLTPGAVAAISVHGQVTARAAAGLANSVDGTAMTDDTVFDLASLTKVVGTTTALMALTARGELDPADPLARFLDWPNTELTLTHLLTHTAGLQPWQPLYQQVATLADAVDLIRLLPLAGPLGSARRYSDLGLILLGAVVEKVTASALADAVAELVTEPLGMTATGFRPPGTPAPHGTIAATSPGDGIEQQMIATGEPYPVIIDGEFTGWRDQLLIGEVADCNAFHALGGVAGHAGIFSTLDDLLTFGHGLLGFGEYPATREVVDRFLQPGPNDQALGWWTREFDSGPAAWHSGYTGTRLLAHPATGTLAVLLSNRLHALVGTQAHPAPAVAPDIAPLWAGVVNAAIVQ